MFHNINLEIYSTHLTVNWIVLGTFEGHRTYVSKCFFVREGRYLKFSKF